MENQLTYRFTTHVNSLGKINIPETMQKFYNKKVEVILIMPKEKKKDKNILNFYNLINQYNLIEEPDLDINTIFNEREQQDARKFIFD